MPLLAAVVVVSLGIGIGVNSSVFTWIQAMVLDPVPGVAGSGSFLLVEPRTESGAYAGASWREYRDLREQLPAFEDLIAIRMVPLNVGEPARTERVFGQLVSGNFFSGLRLRPAIGRVLDEGDASRPGATPVVVISHDYWQTHFDGSPDAIGRSIRVNSAPLTIVGVAPQGFQGTIVGLNFDLWVPATIAPVLQAGSRELESRESRGYSVFGRLAREATRAQADGEVQAAMARLASAYPDSNRGVHAELLPFWWAPRGPQRMLLPAIGILQAMLALVLLAVCGNTANLMLARAGSRHREMAVRLTLGCGRSRVARLVLLETVLLGAGGGVLGILIALWGSSALRAIPCTAPFPFA